jgi:hypothetical protein
MKNLKRFGLRVCFIIVVISAFVECGLAQSQTGVYTGGHFRRGRPATVNNLKASGFRFVILFNIDVASNGDLTVDGDLMCRNGVYVFGSKHPYYAGDVTSLKTGATKINRVETCIGGWGAQSFTHIKNLINSQGTGSNTILYRNFKALKNAIPAIDAINNDDEHEYDVNSTVKFFVMLRDIGFKASMAPYTNSNFWRSVVTNINNQRSGTVDRVYLQCYDGGAGNNPCDWNFGSVPVYPGLWVNDSKTAIRDKMTNWKNNCGSKGGFIIGYDNENMKPAEYAAILNALFVCPITSYVTVNGGAWQKNVTTVSLNPGNNITIGPQPLNGTWSWTGPNFSSTSRSITFNNIQSNRAGLYRATYSYDGCTSSLNFTINVSGAGRSIVSNQDDEVSISDKLTTHTSPNPFGDHTKVTVNLPQAGHTQVSIKSGLRDVGSLHNGYLLAGTHEFEFNARHLPAGIYVCTVTQKGKTNVIRMVKNK